MKGQLLLHLLFQGVLVFDALAWEVRMPKSIHGLKGSCLVIPCSYYYTSYPPKNPHRIVWYQWVSWGYPLVYDPLHPKDIIKKFKGKTDLFRNSSWDCSLLIKNVDQVHHGESLFAWIDPENIGWTTYKFYDVSSTVFVDASPQQPSINIYGGVQTRDTISVVCSTLHTCPYSKPKISLSNIDGSDKTEDTLIENGLWKFSLTRTSVTSAENLTVECTVTYYGGITVTATKSKSAQLALEEGHEKRDTHVQLYTDWLYILVPSVALVCILTCIIAGVIIYKRRRRQTPGDVQGFEQRVTVAGQVPVQKWQLPLPASSSDGEPWNKSFVDASLMREVKLNIRGPALLEASQQNHSVSFSRFYQKTTSTNHSFEREGLSSHALDC